MSFVLVAFVLAADPGLPRNARDCPALFGDARQVDANLAAIDARVLGVVERRDSVDVVHTSGAWREPIKARMPGLTLTAIDGGDAERAVIVDVAPGGPCPAGSYRVQMGDALGARARVVRVLPGAALIEADGKLALLPVVGARQKKLALVWRSDYTLVIDESKKSLAPAAGRRAKASQRSLAAQSGIRGATKGADVKRKSALDRGAITPAISTKNAAKRQRPSRSNKRR